MADRRATRALVAGLLAACALAGAPASAQMPPVPKSPAPASSPPDTAAARFDVVLEGAFVLPQGDLAASFDHTARGFSAGPGYAVGLRARWHATRTLAVSPSFQFAKFGEHEDYDAAARRFRIAPAVIRYGVDVVLSAPGPFAAWRPFVGAGVELAQNRYKETFDADDTIYEASAYALGPRVQAGVRRGDFSLALELRWSRFATPRFFFTGDEARYSWSSAQLTLGYALPRL